MLRGKEKLPLGDSWVVEEDDEGHSPASSVSPPPTSTPRRPSRRTTRSPDPEFFMPPLDRDTLEASWAESTSRSIRPPKSGRIGEGERRGISARQAAGSPEKRGRTKATKNESSIPSKYKESRLQKEPNNLQDILEICIDHGGNMLSWAFDVLGGAFRVLKKPISYILAVYVLFGFLVVARNFVTNSIYASLSPICRIPGVSLLELPFCPAWEKGEAKNGQSVEFDQLMKVQGQFEDIMEESAGRASLPLDMKRGEASIRDLRQLVRYSSLHSK